MYRNSATCEVIYADASKRALSFSENGVGSSVVSLKELLVQTDALQTVLLRLAPHAEARVRHSTVGVQDVVGGVSLNSLRADGEIHRRTTTHEALTSV